MRVKITREQLSNLNRRGHSCGISSVKRIDKHTHLVCVTGTSTIIVVGV